MSVLYKKLSHVFFFSLVMKVYFLGFRKDMLIIKTLQSTGRNILNTRHNSRWSNRNPEVNTESTTKTQPTLQVDKENEETSHKNDRYAISILNSTLL